MTVALIEQLDDRSLVEQHRAGDDDAFRQIVLRHHRSLYANALRRLGDPVLAEDAVQEAFLRAFRSLDRFDGDYHLDAWLHRIVTNTCHDIGRRLARDRRLLDRACTTVEVDAPPADDHLGEATGTGAVDDVLGQLPASYREVLVLRFVEELSYADLAEKAGISEENARARVSRGRNMLKRLMSSTSALVLWAIPPLRRAQVQVGDPESASQAAQRVQDLAGITNVVSTGSAGGWGQLSSLVTQAAPTIATATPAVAGAGSAVKVAMAAGLAAAVAIPTGVAVDRAMEKPVPHAAAPLAEDDDSTRSVDDQVEVTAPTRSKAPDSSGADHVNPMSAAGTPGAVIEGGTQPISDAGSVAGSSSGSEQQPSTSTPPAYGASPAPAPETQPPPASETPPPAPAPPGELRAEELASADAGPSAVQLSGPISLTIGGQVVNGSIDGKVHVGDADPKDSTAPRAVDATLVLRLDDGSVLELRLAGSAVVTEEGPARTLDLDVRFALEGGAALGLGESGTLAGTVVTRDGTATLAITIPGRSS